jgi:hypothetical protein
VTEKVRKPLALLWLPHTWLKTRLKVSNFLIRKKPKRALGARLASLLIAFLVLKEEQPLFELRPASTAGHVSHGNGHGIPRRANGPQTVALKAPTSFRFWSGLSQSLRMASVGPWTAGARQYYRAVEPLRLNDSPTTAHMKSPARSDADQGQVVCSSVPQRGREPR